MGFVFWQESYVARKIKKKMNKKEWLNPFQKSVKRVQPFYFFAKKWERALTVFCKAQMLA